MHERFVHRAYRERSSCVSRSAASSILNDSRYSSRHSRYMSDTHTVALSSYISDIDRLGSFNPSKLCTNVLTVVGPGKPRMSTEDRLKAHP